VLTVFERDVTVDPVHCASCSLVKRKQVAEMAMVDVAGRVLLVDDDDRVLFVLHRALTGPEDACQVEIAQTGSEALDRVRAGRVDLLVTDLVMADMDGVELTRAVRALEPEVVVIWMTAFGCHRVAHEAEELSVYKCLDKPVRIGQIRRIVQEALETPQGIRH
jgi:DNA-binding NtrC family response regulator